MVLGTVRKPAPVSGQGEEDQRRYSLSGTLSNSLKENKARSPSRRDVWIRLDPLTPSIRRGYYGSEVRHVMSRSNVEGGAECFVDMSSVATAGRVLRAPE